MSHARYLALSVLVVGVALAGCTAVAGPAPESSAPVSSVPVVGDPVTITGTGSVTTPLEVPEGAQSLRIDLACTNGIFVVSTAGDLATDRSGQCGGVNHLALPLPEAPTAQVGIRLLGTGQGDGDGESFAATLTFSAEPKMVDPTIAADCETIGRVFTANADADAGFAAGDLDAGGWADTVAKGLTQLDNMIDGTPSPMIAPQAETIRAWLASFTGSGPVPLQGSEPVEVRHANDLIGQVCSDNGTIVSVTPQYGG